MLAIGNRRLARKAPGALEAAKKESGSPWALSPSAVLLLQAQATATTHLGNRRMSVDQAASAYLHSRLCR